MLLILSGLSTSVGLARGFGCGLGWDFLGPLGISIRSIHGGQQRSEKRCPRAAEDQALSFTAQQAAATGDHV